MKKTFILTLALALSFGLGFALNNFLVKKDTANEGFRKVTGIGGVFFKCKEPKKVREWYNRHLGLNVNQYGSVFEWRQAADSTKKGYTQWSPMSEKTRHFEPSTKEFMINYRVADLNRLLDQLRKDGVTIVDTVESASYGKFVHIMDIEGNKIELWEPNDIEYEKLGIQMGSKTNK